MKAFYDEHFALLMRGQDSAYHARVSDFVLRVLELAPGARIIDLDATPFALGHSRWIAHARRPQEQV